MDKKEISIIGNDQYQVIGFKSISYSDILSLTSLYQPLIQGDAMCLYLTLYSESFSSLGYQQFNRLTLIMNMTLNQLINALHKCEQYRLLKTFVKQSNPKQYVFILNHPKGCNEFIEDEIFSRDLMLKLGHEAYSQTIHKFDKPYVDLSQFEDVSDTYHSDYLQNAWTSEREAAYKESRNTKTNSGSTNDALNIFLQSCDEFIFPSSLRSSENISFIQRIMDTYGSNEEIIKKGLLYSIERNQFDHQRFLYFITQNVSSNSNDGYNQPCALFFKKLKQGIELSVSEAKLLDTLMDKYHLSNEIINYILEYALVNNKTINKGLIESYASNVVMNQLTTLDQVKDLFTQNNKKGIKKQKAYQKQPTYNKNYDDSNIDMDDVMKQFQGE